MSEEIERPGLAKYDPQVFSDPAVADRVIQNIGHLLGATFVRRDEPRESFLVGSWDDMIADEPTIVEDKS